MAIEEVKSQEAPAAIGPYSQGIRAGEFVFFSGQIPLDPTTGELVAGGIEEQTERVMNNVQGALAGAGLALSQVVKTVIYLTDMDQFAKVNEIYGRYWQDPAPARATVQVAALPKGAVIEIEWIAYAGK